MKKLFFYITALLFIVQMSYAQHPPKRELRATWLATVWRLDWPTVTVPADGTTSQRQTAINQQKSELIKILDRMKGGNMNTLFFQIRSMSDAMYPSSFENWSSFISSERGADPGWDPLAFAVEEAHKRGMELHAWINPYRYSSSEATHGNLPSDYPNTHPEWLITYDSYTKILNPGIPEVTQRIADIVAEVVTNYDVDGIVFDDYFYGNGMTNDTHDQAQYDLYNPNGLSRADWRRENCNRMIKTVYDRIQSIKPYVTFGVSPAGVAASNPAVAAKYGVPPAPVGSDWQYNGIYADPLAWLQQGSIDYISPQIYWTTTSGIPYDRLAEWWSMVANKFSKHFYSSHSISAMTGGGSTTTPFPAPSAVPQAPKMYLLNGENISEAALSGLEKTIVEDYAVSGADGGMQKAPSATNFAISELGVQVAANRTTDLNDAPGSVFYSNRYAMGVTFLDYLRTEVFKRPAIQPSINWKKAPAQNLVNNLFVSGNVLSWTHDRNDVKYAVYAVPVAESNGQNLYATSAYLIGIAYSKQYTLPAGISSLTHKLAVSVLDRYRNETSVRVLGEVAGTPVAAQLTFPANHSTPIIPALFKWDAVPGADSYVWEVAEDELFNTMICARETGVNQFFSGLQTNILENKTYYWRVKTRKPNTQDTYSQVFSFQGGNFRITSPTNGAIGISLTPTLEWMNVSPTAQYTLQISTNALFPVANLVYSHALNTTSHTLPEQVLMSETTYYARVLVNDGGVQAVSEVISFKTVDMIIPVPVIILPANGSEVSGTDLTITWEAQNSKGFRAEISKDNTFPPRATTVKRTEAYVYSADFTGLADGTYYVQVKALNNTGTTEPSAYIAVTMKSSTGVDNVNNDAMITSYLDKNGKLHILVNETLSAAVSATVYSVTGTMVYTTKFSSTDEINNYTIDLQNYPKGIYVVKIGAGNYNRTLKVVLR